jgi:glutamyl-tRNA reductase
MLRLKEEKSVLENIIVSTCNRTEIYAVVDQLHTFQ